MLQFLANAGAAAQGIASVASALGIGGGDKRPRFKQQIQAQVDLEKELAKNKKYVMDRYEEAGIHPMYAVGAMPSSSASFSLGESGGGSTTAQKIADMGQGVSRAAAQWQTKEQRELEKISASLSLENQQLQNERLRSEIGLMRGAGNAPGAPDPNAPVKPFREILWPSGRKTMGWSTEMGQMLENDPLLIPQAYGHSLSEFGIQDIQDWWANQKKSWTRGPKQRHSGKFLYKKGGK